MLAGAAYTPPASAMLPPDAVLLYKLAQNAPHFDQAIALSPEFVPTSDDQSFFVIWKSVERPKKWIVSLHGSHSFATEDLAIWHRHLKDREVGLICLQWWFGREGPGEYYLPDEVYREIDRLLTKLSIRPGDVMFHGFSRGSANSYAITALDAGRGKKYFALSVASSGGYAEDFPPNKEIEDGGYGKRPLAGTKWILASGGKDPHPDRDGIPAMRRTAAWLKNQGAIVVEQIEVEKEGHGALVRDPASAAKVLDRFLGQNGR